MFSLQRIKQLLLLVFCLGGSFSYSETAKEETAPPMSDEERVAYMVIMNENGIISVSYGKPWFYEVGDYAVSLNKILWNELLGAQTECADLVEQTKTASTARLGPKASHYISLLMQNGHLANALLMSSLLKPYANKDFIDTEREGDTGKLKPLHGEYCVGDGKDNIGIMNQMFPNSENPKSVGGLLWREDACGELHVLKRCLVKVAQWELGQTGRGIERSKKLVDFKEDSHFRPYSTYKAKGDDSIFAQ